MDKTTDIQTNTLCFFPRILKLEVLGFDPATIRVRGVEFGALSHVLAERQRILLWNDWYACGVCGGGGVTPW